MMNGQKIVVISQGLSFSINAIVKALKDNFYEVHLINPTVEEIIDAKKYSRAFLIFTGPYIADSDLMVFLGETISQMKTRVILLGDGEECEVVDRYLPQGFVSDRIEKPFSVKKTVDCVNQIFREEKESRRRKILLVDDDPVFLKMVRNWLSETYDVVPVNSGAQALQYLALHLPDLILLDYEMPVLNGPQVLESIRSLDNLKNIPVFFLTSVDEKTMVTKAIALKPDGYLLKNYERQKVVSSLENFFKNQK